MADDQARDARENAGRQNAEGLDAEEREVTQDRQRLRPRVVYEIVRREGEEELDRPVSSLWWSGVAAGIAISASLLVTGILHHHLPDTPYRPLIEGAGYCVGFIIVILSRMQLFTENTISVILPLLADFGRAKLTRTARLWGVVLGANMTGTFIVALLVTFIGTSHSDHVEGMLAISRHFAELTALEALIRGIPAGFFMAAIVWMLPSAESARFWVIALLTYVIAIGQFAHIVVGSGEVFLLMLAGEVGVGHGFGGLLLPALAGNLIGGTGLFSLLAYAQVRQEM